MSEKFTFLLRTTEQKVSAFKFELCALHVEMCFFQQQSNILFPSISLIGALQVKL
jgi:hypothetical protein